EPIGLVVNEAGVEAIASGKALPWPEGFVAHVTQHRGALAVAVETDLADIAQAVVAVGDAQVAGVVEGFEAPGAVVGNTQGGGDGCGMGGHLLLDGCLMTTAMAAIGGGGVTSAEGGATTVW